MALGGTAELIGVQRLRDKLRAIRDLPGQVSRDPEVSDALIESTQRRFNTKRDPDGRRWAPLSRRWDYSRSRRNSDLNDILRDTGELSRSIGLTGRRGTATSLGFRIGVTGTQRVIARGVFHQLGGRSPITGARVPARPFLGVSTGDLSLVENIVERLAEERINRA